MKKHSIIRLLMVGLTFFQLSTTPLQARERPDTAMIHRIFNYFSTVDTTSTDTATTYCYTSFYLKTNKRNFTLMLVPTMYVVAHGPKREYAGEGYFRFKTVGYREVEAKELVRNTSIPHHKMAMGSIISYLTPSIYETAMVDDYLLSPFNRINAKFYKYRVSFLLNGTARVVFTPKRDNTQLVSGEAVVDYYTGRVINTTIKGEYDLINFTIHLQMGPEGLPSLKPLSEDVKCTFKFVGNKVTYRFHATFGLDRPVDASLDSLSDDEKMSRLRVGMQDPEVKAVYETWKKEQAEKDSLRQLEAATHQKKEKKDDIWEILVDNTLNRVKSHFGPKSQGYIRLNPILNPLYMGYDHRRGFTYKFDLRGSYQFTPNSELTARIKAGYSFKQKRLYYRIPIFYYFNNRRNGYVKFEIGNGNHIRNTAIRRELEKVFPDSSNVMLDRYNEFATNDAQLVGNYDINEWLSLQLGMRYQTRSAVNKHFFKELGWQSDYRSFGPMIEVQVRPLGWNGPIITADYDHGIKGILHSNTSFDRWEINTEYILRLDRLQSLQMRFGTGFYTKDPKHKYFLNYENFKENNIPGGWNDDWSGEFELLNSDTYNYSEYYVRANLSYESPLLLLSWVPWLGHYMEMERIYVSTLDVKSIHPYMEMGYGFTTRAFSMGIFMATKKGKFDGFGCKFGFELFRRW